MKYLYLLYGVTIMSRIFAAGGANCKTAGQCDDINCPGSYCDTLQNPCKCAIMLNLDSIKYEIDFLFCTSTVPKIVQVYNFWGILVYYGYLPYYISKGGLYVVKSDNKSIKIFHVKP